MTILRTQYTYQGGAKCPPSPRLNAAARFSILVVLGAFSLTACSAPLSQTSAEATAHVGGCWPYTVPQPQPSATPRGGAGTTTATPLATTNPHATTLPFAGPWPLCTPEPQTPTHTPTNTPVRTPIPPQTPQPGGSAPPASGNIQEVADQPGFSTNVTAAVNSSTRQIAVGWITWGWSADENTDGQVWSGFKIIR